MERLAIVARLVGGAEAKAAELIAKGPPFDLEASGFERHAIFLSAGEAIFVFEGPQVEWLVEELVDDPLRWTVLESFQAWKPLVEGNPRIARERYFWQRAGAARAGAS